MVLTRTDVNEQTETSRTMNKEEFTSSMSNNTTSQIYSTEIVTSLTNVTTSQLYNGEIVTTFNDKGLYLVWNS